MKTRVYETRTVFAESLEQVFSFFCDAANLDRITPEWLNFEVLTRLPIEMGQGKVIDYRLKLFGFPVRWRSAITRWEPPDRFEDTQLQGPYLKWIHQHDFKSIEGGTLMLDRVQYAVPGWLFEPLVHALFVGKSIRKIFEHRKRAFSQIFNVVE